MGTFFEKVLISQWMLEGVNILVGHREVEK
jgi:hypothetical protein